jgi:hypothetical protein
MPKFCRRFPELKSSGLLLFWLSYALFFYDIEEVIGKMMKLNWIDAGIKNRYLRGIRSEIGRYPWR